MTVWSNLPRPVRSLGFMVWSPEGGMPTRVHSTFDRASDEANRLRAENPGSRFVVMAPVVTEDVAIGMRAWEAGHAAGVQQAHMEIMRAEGVSDRLSDEVQDLRNRFVKLEPIERQARRFQSIVADALLWFDGFMAARYTERPQPSIPDRDQLRELNSALLDLQPADQFAASLDDEVPF